jgi:Glycosyltransferase family 87
VPPLSRNQIIDTPTYQRFGDAVLDGQVPYRDFDIEYPPGALPAFILPSLAAEGDYRTVLEVLMLLCGLGAVVLVARTLDAAGADRGRLLAGCALAGLAPLVLGTVILTRFDLWPALLSAGALAALACGRERLGLGVLGLAVSAKIYPGVLLPIALLYVARRRGGREALVGLGIFAAVLAAVLVPFAILSWDGLLHAFTEQARRPLQIESLGSSVLLAAADLGGYEPTIVSSFGSQNLSGQLPDTLASLQTATQIVAVVAVWILFAISSRRTPQLLAASAAAVAAFAAFGKVLSPQFLIWLIPLVALVLGRLGIVACGLFALVLALTHAYFPKRYFDGLLTLDSGPVWLLVARNVAFVALVVLLATALRRAEPSPR